MASEKVKPVTMWGWTNSKGDVIAAAIDGDMCSDNWYGGTRIRVVVTPREEAREEREEEVSNMTDDLKAAIEHVQFRDTGAYLRRGYDTDLATVLALAEIGRLAVECRHATKSENNGRLNMYLSEDKRDDAADAFLARQKGDK